MPNKREGPPGLTEIRRKERYIAYSRFIVPPPTTPDGYSLQLIGNSPQYLTPKEEAIAIAKIDFGKTSVLKQGSWDGVHVNISSARVVTDTENGKSKQIIQYTTAPGSYFQQRLAIDETTPYESKRKLSHSGATLFAITGDNKIILSSRPDNVQIYPRRLCATASGSWDGEYQKNPNGTDSPLLIPPTPDKAKDHIKAELHDETGLPYGIINAPGYDLKMIGVAEESEKGHWDFLWKFQLPKEITEAQMREFHNEEKTNGNGHENDPTAGHLIFIENSSQGIEKFLADVQTPWDPLSERGLLALGHGLILQEQLNNHISSEEANRAANQWMRGVEEKLDKKYLKINQIVRTHRRKTIHQARKDWIYAASEQIKHTFNPEERKLTVLRRRKAAATIEEYKGYSPRLGVHLTPEVQGLSGVKEELLRTGMLQQPQ